MPDGRLDVQNAARYTGLSIKTLAMMRCHGSGPMFTKVGGRVYYYQDDLQRWIDGMGRFSSTAQARLGSEEV